MKLEFSGRIFERCWNIKFHENSDSGSRVFPCGRIDRWTDGYGAANSPFSQFLRTRLKTNEWTVDWVIK